MSDVSITDLVAEARRNLSNVTNNPVHSIDLDLYGDVLATLESVTAPTEPEWEYGFRADDGPVFTSLFGIPFASAEDAMRVGKKNYLESLEVVRRSPAGPWVEVSS